MTKREAFDAAMHNLWRAIQRGDWDAVVTAYHGVRQVVDAARRARRPDDGPKRNPLVTDRQALERELLRHVETLCAGGRDALEVMAELSNHNGRAAVNPAAMTDDRLAQTLLAARRRVGGRDEGEREPTEAELEPYLEWAASEVPDWSEADRRQLALEQWRGERRHEAWVRGGGRL